MLGPDPSRKGVVVKVGSGVSVAGEVNRGGGGGGGSEETRSLISERLEEKGVGTNGGGGGRADATVQQKRTRWRTKMKM
ncbi:uncharacterized protein MONOS_13453 [Monocercomonoides exilis]|uniref:uncharacterized protein n=1 Tax=Monocercomonoides exilis TaxID=2049356 RepID=UPI003559DFD2|nr:hypothetical protein MONOS_13453 [Monocercomonoides exilis]|eukprot:MONOS_13453.1-p1 / transcript=MONOS_13453.1 / gene=MONOS_13453 / organism=Monocercomonoides_exilis_PA203 / gene_product=unspecified product / transcript_product=unspecified product / location=Mono_scaffold00831:8188-8424(-) / protein_length=79 / sequence_SO=supercontig / SO=protein_coding / is_pseudo=false